MNVNNLELKKTYSNYKELCNTLGITPKSGNSKKAQLKEIERYCKISKIGYSYTIEEIYDTPKNKTYKGNNSLYCEDIQFLIMTLLAEEKEEVVNISCGKLLNILSLVNDNYLIGEKNIESLSEITNIPIKNCLDFYAFSRNNLKKKLEYALDVLEQKKLIIWEKRLQLEIMEIDNNGFIKKIHREATNEEKKTILKIEKEVLINNNWKTVPYMSINLYKKFKKEVYKLLNKYFDFSIKYYYNSYQIIFNEVYIKKELDIVSKRLNSNIIKCLNKEANARHKRAYNKYLNMCASYEDDMPKEVIKFSMLHYQEDYVEYAKKLIDILISLNAQKLTF